MHRAHLTYPDWIAEQLEELREFWWKSTGEVPTTDMLIQRAIEELHHSYLRSSSVRDPQIRKPVARSSRPIPGASITESKAS